MENGADCTARVGVESEQSALQGALTLYVCGKPAVKWVTRCCDTVQEIPSMKGLLPLRHLYFGADGSFNGIEIEQWESAIRYFLREHYWVTLELHPRRIPALLQTSLCSNAHFIPLISVPIPCIAHLGTNAALRIADVGTSSNAGTWRYPLRALINGSTFTPWSSHESTPLKEN